MGDWCCGSAAPPARRSPSRPTSTLARSGQGPSGASASSLRPMEARKSMLASSTSACSGRTVNRPLPALTKTSSIAWATRTAGSRPMIRAAPLSECAALIIDSIATGERSKSSIASTAAESAAVWVSASSRNSSSIENLLRSSTAQTPCRRPRLDLHQVAQPVHQPPIVEQSDGPLLPVKERPRRPPCRGAHR